MTQTKAKHTPGPWEREHCDIYGPYSGRQQLIATAYKEERGRNTVDDGEEAIANACLMTAAPDLLEALKQARADMYAIRSRFSGSQIETVFESMADAAIAKAEGQ
jgi:hypothetical protein